MSVEPAFPSSKNKKNKPEEGNCQEDEGSTSEFFTSVIELLEGDTDVDGEDGEDVFIIGHFS